MSDEAGRLVQRLWGAAERSRTSMDELSQRCDATEERAEQISDAMRRRWQRRAHATQARATARAGDNLDGIAGGD